MRRFSNWLVVAGLVLALGVANYSIYEREQVITSGRLVLLELQPYDPRSLIQGDYMQLRYTDETFPDPETIETLPHSGTIVIRLDEFNVGTFSRLDDGTALAEDEVRLKYLAKDWRGLRIGAESFLFQEGQAETYAPARYGVLRVGDGGTSVLVGLADEAFQQIMPR